MYAIIETGGKQYKVAEGDVVDVELIGTVAGKKVAFNEVLFVHDGKKPHVGDPRVSGFAVQGEILGEQLGPKVVSVKYKPGKGRKKKFGHRQHYSRVQITKIGKGKEEGKSKEEKPKETKVKETKKAKETKETKTKAPKPKKTVAKKTPTKKTTTKKTTPKGSKAKEKKEGSN